MEITEGQKKQQPLPTEKQHLALCCAIIDYGTHMESYQGATPKPVRKIKVKFEIPGEKAVFSEEKGPQCFVVHQTYTLSLDPKANFRKMLDSWMGAPVTALNSERVVKLLKRPGMVQVVHGLSKDGKIKYANIAGKGTSVFKMPAGTEYPKQTENKVFFFDLDNFTQASFEMLDKWDRETVEKSAEFKALGNAAGTQTAMSTDEFEEDLPF